MLNVRAVTVVVFTTMQQQRQQQELQDRAGGLSEDIRPMTRMKPVETLQLRSREV